MNKNQKNKQNNKKIQSDISGDKNAGKNKPVSKKDLIDTAGEKIEDSEKDKTDTKDKIMSQRSDESDIKSIIKQMDKPLRKDDGVKDDPKIDGPEMDMKSDVDKVIKNDKDTQKEILSDAAKNIYEVSKSQSVIKYDVTPEQKITAAPTGVMTRGIAPATIDSKVEVPMAQLECPKFSRAFPSAVKYVQSPTGINLYQTIDSDIKIGDFSTYKEFFVQFGLLINKLVSRFSFILDDIPKIGDLEGFGNLFFSDVDNIGTNFIKELTSTKWQQTDVRSRYMRIAKTFPANAFLHNNPHAEQVTLMGAPEEIVLWNTLTSLTVERYFSYGPDVFVNYLREFNLEVIALKYTSDLWKGRMRPGFYSNYAQTANTQIEAFMQISLEFRFTIYEMNLNALRESSRIGTVGSSRTRVNATNAMGQSLTRANYSNVLSGVGALYDPDLMNDIVAVALMSSYIRWEPDDLTTMNVRDDVRSAEYIVVRLFLMNTHVTSAFSRLSIVYLLVHIFKHYSADANDVIWDSDYWINGNGREVDPCEVFGVQEYWDIRAQTLATAANAYFGDGDHEAGWSANGLIQAYDVGDAARSFVNKETWWSVTGEVFNNATQSPTLYAKQNDFNKLVTAGKRCITKTGTSVTPFWSNFDTVTQKQNGINRFMWTMNTALYYYSKTPLSFIKDPTRPFDLPPPLNYAYDQDLPESLTTINQNATNVSNLIASFTKKGFVIGSFLALALTGDFNTFGGLCPSIPYITRCIAFAEDTSRMFQNVYLAYEMSSLSGNLFLNKQKKEMALKFYEDEGGKNLSLWRNLFESMDIALPALSSGAIKWKVWEIKAVRRYLSGRMTQAHGFTFGLWYTPNKSLRRLVFNSDRYSIWLPNADNNGASPADEAVTVIDNALPEQGSVANASEIFEGLRAGFFEPIVPRPNTGIRGLVSKFDPWSIQWANFPEVITYFDLNQGLSENTIRVKAEAAEDRSVFIAVPVKTVWKDYSQMVAMENVESLQLFEEIDKPYRIGTIPIWTILNDTLADPRNLAFLPIDTFGITAKPTTVQINTVAPFTAKATKYITFTNEVKFTRVSLRGYTIQ